MKIIEKRMMPDGALHELCIKRNFYACGTNEEYDALLQKVAYPVNITPELLYELAKDIHAHNEDYGIYPLTENNDIASIMYYIAQVCITYFEIEE